MNFSDKFSYKNHFLILYRLKDMNFQSFIIFWIYLVKFIYCVSMVSRWRQGGGLTSQTDGWSPPVSDWASPVSTADQSTGQHGCWGPPGQWHRGATVGSHVGPRGRHLSATSAVVAGDVRRDGVDGELAVFHRRWPGGHRSHRSDVAHRLVVMASPETAGVDAGVEP